VTENLLYAFFFLTFHNIIIIFHYFKKLNQIDLCRINRMVITPNSDRKNWAFNEVVN